MSQVPADFVLAFCSVLAQTKLIESALSSWTADEVLGLSPESVTSDYTLAHQQRLRRTIQMLEHRAKDDLIGPQRRTTPKPTRAPSLPGRHARSWSDG